MFHLSSFQYSEMVHGCFQKDNHERTNLNLEYSNLSHRIPYHNHNDDEADVRILEKEYELIQLEFQDSAKHDILEQLILFFQEHIEP